MVQKEQKLASLEYV